MDDLGHLLHNPTIQLYSGPSFDDMESRLGGRLRPLPVPGCKSGQDMMGGKKVAKSSSATTSPKLLISPTWIRVVSV